MTTAATAGVADCQSLPCNFRLPRRASATSKATSRPPTGWAKAETVEPSASARKASWNKTRRPFMTPDSSNLPIEDLCFERLSYCESRLAASAGLRGMPFAGSVFGPDAPRRKDRRFHPTHSGNYPTEKADVQERGRNRSCAVFSRKSVSPQRLVVTLRLAQRPVSPCLQHIVGHLHRIAPRSRLMDRSLGEQLVLSQTLWSPCIRSKDPWSLPQVSGDSIFRRPRNHTHADRLR